MQGVGFGRLDERPGSTMTLPRRTAGRDWPRVALVMGCLTMIAVLAVGVWLAFSFSSMALASSLDPDCPVGGCYSPRAAMAAPIVATLALVVGIIHLAIGLRQRFALLVPWLFIIVVVQWLVTGSIMAMSLVD